MKYCKVDGSRYPDGASKCRMCGAPLVPASAVEDFSTFSTSCCPNAQCSVLVALPETTFCGKCGTELQPISFDLWLKKIVEPAFEKNPVDVLLRPSIFFAPAAEMGLERTEALKRLDRFLTDRAGFDRTEFSRWLQDAVAILNDPEQDFETATRQAEKLATDRKIPAFPASLIVDMLATEMQNARVTPEVSGAKTGSTPRKADAGVDSSSDARITVKKHRSESPSTAANASAPHLNVKQSFGNGHKNGDDAPPSEPGASRSTSEVEPLPPIHVSPSSLPSGEADAPSTPVENTTGGMGHKTSDKFIYFITVSAVVVGVVLLIWKFLPTRRLDAQNEKMNANRSSTPAPSPPDGMAYIQGGDFLMGSNEGGALERPAHKVHVEPFFLDVKEVTCIQYQRFIEVTHHRPPLGWRNNRCPRGSEDFPVTGVDWYAADEYARWFDNRRLPEEKEWEFAASEGGLRYPWGNEWVDDAANAGKSSQGRVVKVGMSPRGKSKSGILDLIGNAWEWTATNIEAYPEGRSFRPEKADMKVIRGGAYDTPGDQATATHRGYWYAKDATYSKTGFRCAKSIQ